MVVIAFASEGPGRAGLRRPLQPWRHDLVSSPSLSITRSHCGLALGGSPPLGPDRLIDGPSAQWAAGPSGSPLRSGSA